MIIIIIISVPPNTPVLGEIVIVGVMIVANMLEMAVTFAVHEMRVMTDSMIDHQTVSIAAGDTRTIEGTSLTIAEAAEIIMEIIVDMIDMMTDTMIDTAVIDPSGPVIKPVFAQRQYNLLLSETKM